MKHTPTTSAVPSPQGFVSPAFQSSSCASNQGLDGSPKFLYASLCTCHSLLTPETLHILTTTDASVLPSVYVKTLGDLNLPFEAVPALRSYELPTACTILCVRFTHFVHLWKCFIHFGSAVGATLDTGGWLTLSRQGLSPCKMHQALLGALTSQITGAKTQSEERAALFCVRVHLPCYALTMLDFLC